MKIHFLPFIIKQLLILLLTLLGFSFVASGQYSINGTVTDNQQNALTAVTVTAFSQPENTFTKAAITNDAGVFIIQNLKPGKLILEINSLGFSTYRTALIEIKDTNVNLKTIILQTRTEELEAVTVIAEKPLVEVKADRTIFNVQSSISASGISGFELLRKAPGVIIDNNDNLMVEGKNGVQIFIDGRPSPLNGTDLINYLKTIQSSDIESIEIITQPSSKYDAAGNAGIVNIIFKRDKSLGVNGSVSSGFTIGDFARYNNAVSFNSRNKTTSLFGSYSNRFGKSASFLNLLRTQNNTQFNARSETIGNNNSNNIKLGYDVYATSKSTFGILVNGNFNNSFGDTNSRTPIIPSGNTSPEQVLRAESNTQNTSNNLFANFNYQFKDTLGHKINADFDYGVYSSDRFNFQPNTYFNGEETEVISESIFNMITPIDIRILTLQADYEQNFHKGTLALGFKISDIKTENQFDFFDRINGEDILNLGRSNTFAYDENVNAVYFNYSRQWKKYSFQFGLRMEQTRSTGSLESATANENDQVKRNYTNFFPSGGITYKLNQKNAFALLYSRRIQRPNYQSLNPFEYRIDELSFRQGNPFLQPQYTDNLKLSHTYNYRLTTSLSYSFISDFFAQITEAAPNDQNFISTRNVANQKVINLSISYPTKFTKWWNVYFNLNAYRSIYEATTNDFIALSQNTLSFYGQNTFSLPKNFKLEVSGWYSSPSVWGGTYQTKSLGSFNLALQKKFFDNKFTVRLAANDLFFTAPWRGDTQFGDLFIRGNGGYDSRQFSINISYNFGRKEVKAARKRKTGIENEKNRID
ncbi:TonB-dependent receptor domain-containing protein [Ascidiimonas sp. W6]|uniref:TonB-dependent receptor domain-containing protein n=1 Tax=Ascidiimonas meishanensis TaxID=3128903 RepID=UPI0030ED3B49